MCGSAKWNFSSPSLIKCSCKCNSWWQTSISSKNDSIKDATHFGNLLSCPHNICPIPEVSLRGDIMLQFLKSCTSLYFHTNIHLVWGLPTLNFHWETWNLRNLSYRTASSLCRTHGCSTQHLTPRPLWPYQCDQRKKDQKWNRTSCQ